MHCAFIHGREALARDKVDRSERPFTCGGPTRGRPRVGGRDFRLARTIYQKRVKRQHGRFLDGGR